MSPEQAVTWGCRGIFARGAGWNANEGEREPRLEQRLTPKKLHTPVISTPKGKETVAGTPTFGE
jgi:hypothetical protein